MTPFDPEQLIILTTDASPVGISAILSHMIDDTERLRQSEMNYSQLDQKAFGIVFGVINFYDYLFGTHFTLIIDNQPLSRIFASNTNLTVSALSRLLHYASFLLSFDYTVKFKKDTDNANADCLLRAPFTLTAYNELTVPDETSKVHC